MQSLEDSELLRRYADQRSEEAFAVLADRHVNLVYSVAFRQVGNAHGAEEITQAVFIILARKAAQLRHGKALSSWLFQTARLTASNFLRTEMRRQRREQEAFMDSTLNEPADAAWPHMAHLLDPAVEALGEPDRRAIVLRFYEGRNLRDVGLALGASEAAAEKRVQRALEKLRKYFSRRGITLAAAAIAGAASVHSVHAAPAGLAKSATAAALAKGAAASGSTSALVKGALKIMAWTKAKLAIAVGAGVLLAAGTTTVVIEEVSPIYEPSYQGRSLTEWMGDLDNGTFQREGPKQIAAEDAIRHIGKAALPFLVNDLANDQKLQPHNLRRLKPDTRTVEQRFIQAGRAFEVLGPVARPAIPKLVRLLQQNPGFVPGALVGIGREALPEVRQALTNSDFFVRDNTAAALANAVYAEKIAAAEVKDVIPLAARNLAYTSTNALFEGNTRWRAAGLIAAIHLDPEICVPALVEAIQDSGTSVREECAEALGSFGPDAQAATPALVNMMRSTNASAGSTACWALSKIEPAALVRDALSETIAYTTNADVRVQMYALWALRQAGPRAEPAVPAVIATLSDSNYVVRMNGAQALGGIAQHPDEAVPALMRALRDPNEAVRVESVNALYEFGGHAREAVPDLLEAVKADPSLRGNVARALSHIDPTAVASLK